MKKIFLIFCAAFLLMSGFIHAQCASHVQSLNERLAESNYIFEGLVIEQEAFRGTRVDVIYTANTIEIFKVFKGELTTATIEIITMGGTIDNERMTATPSLGLNIGEKGTFLMKTYAGQNIPSRGFPILRPVADNASSFVKYSPDATSASDITRQFNDLEAWYAFLDNNLKTTPVIIKPLPVNVNKTMALAPAITSFTPTTVTAGTATVITITGTGFGTTTGTVFFSDANNGGASLTSAFPIQILSWTDTQIEVEVPSRAGTGSIAILDNGGALSPSSATTLNVTYAQLTISTNTGIFDSEFVDDAADGDGGYKFLYSSSTANGGVDITSIAAATASVERALATWQTSTGLSFYIGGGCGTSTVQVPGSDATNILTFDNSVWDLDIEAGSSTLGVMYSYFGICGPSAWEVVATDMVMRRDGDPNGTGGNVAWQYGPALPAGSESDFESVILHEFGHGSRLGHINSPGAVMHYSITTGTHNRTLSAASDIAGSNFVQAHAIAYNPPIINCGADYNAARQYTTYSAANDCGLLVFPVELLDFAGEARQKHVDLTWQTTQEINNDYFQLERSRDGIHFESIAKVAGAGTTNEVQHYSHTDQQPLIGANYYRLVSYNFDGTSDVSAIILVEFKGEGQVQIFPNPVTSNQFNLSYTSADEGDVQFQLFDVAGKLIQTWNDYAVTGNNNFEVNIELAAKGVYFLRTTQGSWSQSTRLVKQ